MGLESNIANWNVPHELLGAMDVGGARAEILRFGSRAIYEGRARSPRDILSLHLAPDTMPWTRPLSRPDARFDRRAPLCFWQRSTRCEIKTSGLPTTTLTVYFDEPAISRPDAAADAPVDVADLGAMQVMRLLHDEILVPGFASVAMVESLTEILRVKLSRALDAPDASETARVPLERELQALIRDYVEGRRGSAPSVSDLARICSTSRRSLLRRFKAATGMTVADYIGQLQLAKAKAMLADTDQRLKQIAWETGFVSQSSFSHAFKRQVGLTPSAFRNDARAR